MTIGLGIDTGGTFTDSVLVEMETGEVLGKSKSRTTHRDLSEGIRDSILGLDRDLLRRTDIVSLSSTLATNAVVEGRHGRVALVSIGRKYEGETLPEYRIDISGGHSLHGGEEDRLDVESARAFIESMRGKVDAFAISSLMSVRNPEHELRVRDMVSEILGIPAVCGHELSSNLGFHIRGSTCVIDAGLIPVMSSLIDSVKEVMAELEVDAPLLVVRGNGSLMGESMARLRPVETVISGPAASMMGAMAMTGIRDAVVVDIGGTTTDIGVIRGGMPSVDPEGITVGGRRTHISAARVDTAGMGGDSRIFVKRGKVGISPIRAIPLCIAARMWPETLAHLRSPNASDYEMCILSSDYDGRIHITPAEASFLEMISDAPASITKAAASLGCRTTDIDADLLERFGYIRRISFTPTDLLAATGVYTDVGTEASEIGLRIISEKAGMTPESFVESGRRAIILRIGREILKTALTEDRGDGGVDDSTEFLLRRALFGGDGVVKCGIGFDVPIVGIGASSKVYVKWVADAFGTEAVFSEDSDVGNAIGAISAPVSESIVVSVTPETMDSPDSGFEVFSKAGRFDSPSLEEAIDRGCRMAEARVAEILESQDAKDVTFTRRREDLFLPGHTRRILMEVRITVTGTGRPGPFVR